MYALAVALSAYAYQQVVGSNPRGKPGEEAVLKTEYKQTIDPKNKNIGIAYNGIGERKWYHEGSWFTNMLNEVPLGNATGTGHDILGNKYFSETSWYGGMAYLTIPPSIAVTFGAGAAQYPSAWSMYYDWRR